MRDDYELLTLGPLATFVNGSVVDDAWYTQCGFVGEPIRSENISLLPGTLTTGPMTTSLGTCQEYTNLTNKVMPLPFVTDYDSLFKELDSGVARMCAHHAEHAETGFFLQFVSVVVLLAYLVYMKRVVRTAAIFEDTSSVTTGDYSVLLRGLKDGMGPPSDERITADELKAFVYADLKAMGFKRDRIAQVEVGRNCGEEIKLLQRLEKLNIEKHELAARDLLRQQGNLKWQTKAKDQEKTLKLAKEMAEVVGRTKELYELEDFATGHAFVIFQYEADRNKFIRMAHTPARGRKQSGSAVAPAGHRLSRSARPDSAPEVVAAPEPSEVCWESLELDDAHERRVVRLGRMILAAELGVCASLIVAAKALIAIDKESPIAPSVSAVSPLSLTIVATVPMVCVTSLVPAAACCTLRAIAWVADP